MTDWQEFYRTNRRTATEDLLHFEPWQRELAAHICDLTTRGGSVLEAGSGYGQTGLLIAGRGRRVTLLDNQLQPLAGGRDLFARQKMAGEMVCGNLFRLPFADQSHDLVFNAGVLEHFSFAWRQKALAEMWRCTRTGGRVVVAVPNHYSRPYRYSYLYLQRHNQWPYPEERMIHDLSREIDGLGLSAHQSRITLDSDTAFFFLRRHQRILFRLLGLVHRFEGYLSVLTLEKRGQGE